DLLEQRSHVAEVRDRYADLADLAFGERVIAVVAGLRGEIEGDGQSGLTLGEVLAVERVRIVRGRMPGVSTEDPGPVAPAPCAVRWLAHCRLAWALPGDCAVHHTGAAPARIFPWDVDSTHKLPRLVAHEVVGFFSAFGWRRIMNRRRNLQGQRIRT